MQKTAVVYDLNTLIRDDLKPLGAELAEQLGRSEAEIADILSKSADQYARGELSQGEHWEDMAFKMGLNDTDIFSVLALNHAEIDNELIGRVRAQSGQMVLGLVSDATPDWVGHWRQTLQLDRLFHANIIDSELQGGQTYADLLKLAAERLQSTPAKTWFVGRTPTHLAAAEKLSMPIIDLATATDYPTAFAPLS